MSNQPTFTDESFVARAWRSWCDFWFRPRDPSTLGLMRILAGIFIVYTHLAYSTDLQSFFGKDAFIDLTLAEQARNDLPVVAPSNEWEDAPNNIYLPPDPTDRRVFLEWAVQLPEKPEDRQRVLRFFTHYLPPGETAIAGLAFVENLLIRPRDDRGQGRDPDAYVAAPAGEREKLLALLVAPALEKADPKVGDRELIPKYLREMPLTPRKEAASGWEQNREEARQVIESLIRVLPDPAETGNPPKLARLFGHFVRQSLTPLPLRKHTDPRTQFERTVAYLRDLLPNDPKARDEAINYLKRWGVDLGRTYARGQFTWSVWFHVTNPTAMVLIHIMFIGFMVLFTLGLFTRVTSVLTWVGALCYMHRSQQVLFGMDTMMNINMLYLMIGPSGAAYSLDRLIARWRANKVLRGAVAGDKVAAAAILAGPPPTTAANLATRLFQVHFCIIYAASGLAKLKGGTWWSHTALWYTMANPEFSPIVFGPYRWLLNFLSDHRLLWELVMSGGVVFTLALEIGLPFLVWRPRLRPYVLAAALMLHTGIATIMGLTVFSIMMMILLMSFIPPEVVRKWIDTGGRLFVLPGRRLGG